MESMQRFGVGGICGWERDGKGYSISLPLNTYTYTYIFIIIYNLYIIHILLYIIFLIIKLQVLHVTSHFLVVFWFSFSSFPQLDHFPF